MTGLFMSKQRDILYKFDLS